MLRTDTHLQDRGWRKWSWLMSLEVRVVCVSRHHICKSSKLEKKGEQCSACELHGAVIGNNQLHCGVRAHLISGDSRLKHISAPPAQLPTKDKDTCIQQSFFSVCLCVIKVVSRHLLSPFHLFLCSCSGRAV